MFIVGIESINENDIIGINESFGYNGIYFQNLDNTLTNLNSPPLFKNEEKGFSNTHFPLYHIINKENVIINNYEGISTDFLSKK